MSDFPELDDDFGGSAAPTGDWRSQERAILGDSFDDAGAAPQDFETSASHFPGLDDEPAAPASATSQPARNDFVNSFERDAPAAAAPPANVSVSGHDELAAFESQFPDVEVRQPPAAQQQSNGFHAPSVSATSAPKLSSSQIAEPDSEPIRAWREKRATEIAERDEAAKKKHQEIVERAEKAIDDFYQDYNAKKERQIAKNKEEEAAFEAERTDKLAKGTTWERIAELVELQDSRSKTSTRATRDLSRFKETLLALKREGETAPGAAGF